MQHYYKAQVTNGLTYSHLSPNNTIKHPQKTKQASMLSDADPCHRNGNQDLT